MPKGSEQAYSTPANGGFAQEEVGKGFKVLEKPGTPEHDPPFRDSVLKENVRKNPHMVKRG